MLYNIWVTTACNLCCSYCYEGAHKQGINMNKETADQILKYMCSKVEKSSDKYTVVNYHGGEPLQSKKRGFRKNDMGYGLNYAKDFNCRR